MTKHSFKPILLDLLRQAQISQNAFFQELTPAELATIGTPEYWSAKDHVAHMTFWRQRLVLRLQAIIRKVPQPKSENFEQLNPSECSSAALLKSMPEAIFCLLCSAS